MIYTNENIPRFIVGDHEEETILQFNEALKHDAVFGVLCADGHVGYSIPIGAVIAYRGKICVNGVGFDIGCGCKAVRLDSDTDYIRYNIVREMNEIQKHISFGIGRKNNEVVSHELFDDSIWNEISWLGELRDMARSQLGTVGGGNHFVDVFVDDFARIWVGVHFGSRGLGHKICTYFIKQAGGKDGIHAAPVVLDEKSDLGEQYIKCMELAGRYAYAGRDWVCSRVARILRGEIQEEVHNHHNFAWRETHFGENLWVVRKGATPNQVGQKSFVGGTMGDFSYILRGISSDENKNLLYSTIHGAGRILGRSQAKGKVDRKTGQTLRPGLVSKDEMESWLQNYHVELRGGDVDESPHCYKRIEKVLYYHRESTEVVERLKPIGVCMAGSRDFDPFKD